MKKLLLMLMLLIFVPLCVSPTFAQYEPPTQMGLPDGAIARFGKGSFYGMEYSPDGKTIATIPVGTNQQGGTVRLWDVATGELLKTLKGHSNCDYNSVAYFPDSKTIITGHRDGTMLLWDIPTR